MALSELQRTKYTVRMLNRVNAPITLDDTLVNELRISETALSLGMDIQLCSERDAFHVTQSGVTKLIKRELVVSALNALTGRES